MSMTRSFHDTAFTHDKLDVPTWVHAFYTRAADGQTTLTEVQDVETGKNILNRLTTASYRRLETTARQLGEKNAVPDSRS